MHTDQIAHINNFTKNRCTYINTLILSYTIILNNNTSVIPMCVIKVLIK